MLVWLTDLIWVGVSTAAVDSEQAAMYVTVVMLLFLQATDDAQDSWFAGHKGCARRLWNTPVAWAMGEMATPGRNHTLL